MAILRVLWKRDGVTQRELCREVGIAEATGVKGIARLAAAGFVKRTIDAPDKRKIVIRLTPHARALEAKLIPMVVEINERALAGITKIEADIARKVLAKIYFNLNKED
jgi:DNA-binding MarR family transcriptional regulator